jgi:hypothetical protein
MTAKATPRDSSWHAEDLPTFRALAEFAPWPPADPGGLVGVSRGSGAGTRGFPHRHDIALGA